MKTYLPNVRQVQEKKWYVVDVAGQVLGRVASRIATVLQGKHKSTFVPNVDMGDFVVVLNSGKIRVTGRKPTQKIYYRHSGYMGGLKARAFRDQLARDSTQVIRMAVRNMLPKNALGRKRLSKLKIYSGDQHPHVAQNPQPLVVNGKW